MNGITFLISIIFRTLPAEVKKGVGNILVFSSGAY